MPHYIKVSQTASTNTYLSRLAATLPGGTVIYTPSQTAGRGQKGNSWESEDGKNLTFSHLLKRPPVKARDQFYLSEAAALAVVEALAAEAGDGFSVKWPNDVYWRDKKVCGMLLENSLDGSDIAHCIVGIGINVNQERFLSSTATTASCTHGKTHQATVSWRAWQPSPPTAPSASSTRTALATTTSSSKSSTSSQALASDN